MKKGKTKKSATLKAAVAWYKPNQWQRLREISEDREELEETLMTSQKLKTLTIRHCDFNKLQGMSAS
jgi:hypothetical protein